LPKKRWPKIRHREKRAITLAEHQRIVEAERNPERRAFYQLAWHLGASQTDIALLEAKNIDWEQKTVAFTRKKCGSRVLLHFDRETALVLRSLPQKGPLFPYLRSVRAGDRATEFKQRCDGLGVKGVSLHSYRYAWAERALAAGMPERFAQEALGHNSKAVHRAYARRAKVKVPPLSEYERHRMLIDSGLNNDREDVTRSLPMSVRESA
jgi:integrase